MITGDPCPELFNDLPRLKRSTDRRRLLEPVLVSFPDVGAVFEETLSLLDDEGINGGEVRVFFVDFCSSGVPLYSIND